MNTLHKPTQRKGAFAVLVLLASIATPALADHDEDGYRGRGYDAPRYQNYDRGGWGDRGGRGDWGREHGYRHHGGDRDAYYVTPYYQPPRVIYAPPPVVYYPSVPYRSGIEVRLLQMF